MPNTPATGWKVEHQDEQLGLNARGQAVPGMQVYFVTGKGIRSSVFVPKDRYTPDNVRAAVAQAANQIDQVQGATG